MATRREITSGKNPAVQRFRDAADGKLPDLLLAEGPRLVREALAAGLRIDTAAWSPRCADRDLARDLVERAATFLDCNDEAMARLSSLDTPQGVAVLVQRKRVDLRDLLAGVPLVVACAGLRDPGNLGSVLRTAEAAGATGCISCSGGADPFRDKAVRGSMGSIFRLPVVHGLDPAAVVQFAREHRLRLVVADGRGALPHTAADLRGPTLLVVGAEAAGVPEVLRTAAQQLVRIPLREPVESLNVAVAAGVLLFEAQRQRG